MKKQTVIISAIAIIGTFLFLRKNKNTNTEEVAGIGTLRKVPMATEVIDGVKFERMGLDKYGNPIWRTSDWRAKLIGWRRHKDMLWYGQSYNIYKTYNEIANLDY